MSESRLDGQVTQQAAVRGAVLKLKENPRLSGLFSRLAFFSQPGDLSPVMVERLCQNEPALNSLICATLASAMHELGMGNFQDLSSAIEKLGPNRARRCLLTAGVGIWANTSLAKAKIPMNEFLNHSIAIGCTAARFAKASKEFSPDQMYGFGILLHLGVPLLALLHGETFGAAWTLSHPDVEESEFEALGITHGIAGEILATELGFSPNVIQSMPNHHHDLEKLKGVPQLVALAELVAQKLGFKGGTTRPTPDFRPSWPIRMGLMEDDWTGLKLEIESECRIAGQVFAQKAA